MKAAAFGPHGLEIRDVAKPQVKPTQLLVRVHYASLNRRDLTRGDRVMCMGGGGYAEYAVTEAGQALPIPRRGSITAMRRRSGAKLKDFGGDQGDRRQGRPPRH